jgi:RHS repeat-associated protein
MLLCWLAIFRLSATLAVGSSPVPPLSKLPSTAPSHSKWAPLQIADAPTIQEIVLAAFFDRPLMPVREPTAFENEQLLLALQNLAQRTVRDDFSSLTTFAEAHPGNPWAPAIETQLGREFYRTGHYSRAIGMWQHVWDSNRSERGQVSTTLANQAGSELGMMYARLGRMTELRALLDELQKRPEHGKVPRAIRGATEGLWSMEHRPEVSFRCGPLALDRICFATDRAKAGNSLIQNSASTTNGFSARQVADLSRQLGMNYRVAFRNPGAPLILPAVVHWKVGHYAALIARDGALLRADDPTFGNKTWLSDAALDQEGSGYFLVRSGPLPAGWRRVSDTEAAGVWGRGTTLQSDPDSTTEYDQTAHSCGGGPGMASWNITLLLANLHAEDTPVGYTPPVGPPMYFTVSYDAVDALGLQTVPYSNVAPDWRINWLAWITDDPMNPAGDIQFAADGGGTLTFTDYNPTNQIFKNLFRNRADLVRTGTNSYEVRYPDGSKKIFDLPDGAVGSTRKIYMTAVVDPTGNAATIQFEFPGKISSVTDAIGQQTKLHYDFAYTAYLPIPDPPYLVAFPGTNTFLLTSVEDPFGRTATFTVNSPTNFNIEAGVPIVSASWAQMTNIVDAVGLQSGFTYAGPFMTSLTTPYGQTQFTPGSYNGLYRANWIEITYPNGEKERVEYSEIEGNGIPSSESLSIVPKGVPVRNYILYGRNTYYWDRKAYAAGYSPLDYTGARVYHWAHGLDYTTASPILESYKAPRENRVWLNYNGQVNASFAGTSDRPTEIARTMEDGTTQLYQFAYNPLGNPTQAIDPLGRTFSLAYSTNDVDLIEMRQTRAGQNDLIFSATYNDQHRPLTIAGPDRQTNQFTYNARGQLLSVMNARGDITSFSYDANGYLLSINGPLPGTNDISRFTYDPVGRLRTTADPDGYTLVIDYDNLDRITQITFPDGTFDQITYDRLDPVALRDRAGRVTTLTYDSLRRLIASQDPLGRITRYQWCGCNGLEAVIDPLGRMTSWIRDLQGRVTTKVYPDGSQESIDYDSATGWVKSTRDAQNQVTVFDYNLDGTLRQKRYLNALLSTPAVKFTYDPNYNRITAMQDGNGLTTYTYGPVQPFPSLNSGKLVSIDGPFTNDTTDFVYDLLGRVATRTINGVGVNRVWDEAGRLTQLTNVLGSFSYSWEGSSYRLSSITRPNGQRSTYGYSPVIQDSLLQRITHLNRDNTTLSEFTYDYGSSGVITNWNQFQNGAHTAWSAGYDTADRLLRLDVSQGGAATETFMFAYDDTDNRVLEAENGIRQDYEYNSLNELIRISNSSATNVTYFWDAAKRLVAISNGIYQTEFHYDGLDRCTEIIDMESGAVTADRLCVWSQMQLCEERDAVSGSVLRRFTGNGEEAEAGSELPAGSYFFLTDHLDSVREVTDSAGSPRAEYAYDPFGVRSRLAGDVDTDFGFSGRRLHAGSGLQYSVFRNYDPQLGRWLNRDPGGEGSGMNLYAYANNSPLTVIDPFGLFGFSFDLYAGIGMSLSISYAPETGSYSISPEFGVGAGIGASFDPDAVPATPEKIYADENWYDQVTIGGEAGAGAGPLSAKLSLESKSCYDGSFTAPSLSGQAKAGPVSYSTKKGFSRKVNIAPESLKDLLGWSSSVKLKGKASVKVDFVQFDPATVIAPSTVSKNTASSGPGYVNVNGHYTPISQWSNQ